jgi:tripartite-type tricarboxylate transporter receptor subunit TctC
MASTASAQGYPNRPLKLLVGAPPGGGNDIVARIVARKMSENLGQPVVIENRPGAGATIATEVVAKAQPDGYTLLLTPSAHALSATIYPKLPYDSVRSFTSIGEIAVMPTVLIVPPNLPVNTVSDLIALAKSKPGELNYASGGNGTAQHLGGELLKLVAGVDITHVPYKGSGPAVADLMSSQVHLMVDTAAAALPHIKSGKVKALAVSSKERFPSLPNIPTTEESGLRGFEVAAWYGLLAPANTPAPIVSRLNAELNKALEDRGTQVALEAQGARVTGGPPEQFMLRIAREIERWRPVIQKAGVVTN